MKWQTERKQKHVYHFGPARNMSSHKMCSNSQIIFTLFKCNDKNFNGNSVRKQQQFGYHTELNKPLVCAPKMLFAVSGNFGEAL